MVRARITPVILALEGLAKRAAFESLDENDAGQTAILMLRYAKGEIRLDAGRSDNPETQMWGIKLGIEGLSREHVFESLPAESRREAAILLSRYARREHGIGSPHFPVEDLTGGIVRRARKALKREFILTSLPAELRDGTTNSSSTPRNNP